MHRRPIEGRHLVDIFSALSCPCVYNRLAPKKKSPKTSLGIFYIWAVRCRSQSWKLLLKLVLSGYHVIVTTLLPFWIRFVLASLFYA